VNLAGVNAVDGVTERVAALDVLGRRSTCHNDELTRSGMSTRAPVL
jgi:hypothetical protein